MAAFVVCRLLSFFTFLEELPLVHFQSCSCLLCAVMGTMALLVPVALFRFGTTLPFQGSGQQIEVRSLPLARGFTESHLDSAFSFGSHFLSSQASQNNIWHSLQVNYEPLL